MKHVTRILLLAVAFVTGLTTVLAQPTVHVNVRQKVPSLPAAATNYLDDPFRYFDIELFVVNAGDGLDVFFDIDFSLDGGDEDSFYIRTQKNKAPLHSIHLSEGFNSIKRDAMLNQLRGRKSTSINFEEPLKAQQLPEGTYQLCLDVYLWSDKDNPAREPISDGNCPAYEICYSASAPELVSPMAGAQLALNGAKVLTPSRKVNFSWTPVISNCNGGKINFNYKLKVVKVLKGQNYQDAIVRNPTVFSTEVRNNTFAVFDTLRDIKVQMETGALYVAQVQAEQIKTSRSTVVFKVANDGNSQPMPFFWGGSPDADDYYMEFDDEDPEMGDDSDGVDGLTYWDGGEEEVSELDDILEEAFPDDQTIVIDPKHHYVESDGYCTIPMTDDLEIGFKGAEHKALKKVSYEVGLYDYLDGDVDSITSQKPLLSEKLETLPESRTFTGWGAKLKQGKRYYLQLASSFTVEYWKYSIADTSYYVNEMLAEHFHDTVSREFVEEELERSNGVFFQWGDNPNAPAFTTPQWKAPVDRSGDDIYDPENYDMPTSLPEIQKTKTFPVSWTPVKDVTQGDEVEYVVNVYELKPNQTMEEAISDNEAIVTRTVTDANEISENDTKFFKAFSSQKTYVMTLSTTVSGDSDTEYHFKNGNEAFPIVFKIVK